MKIFESVKSIKKAIAKHKERGKKIALVPTMGALHQGHLSLIKLAQKKNYLVVVSIFVNQKQFNNAEDFNKYPQNLAEDLKMLQQNGIDILFLPKAEEIYPPNFTTHIHLQELSSSLCGKTRPGHFDGVALIITKLFNIITPHAAIFGEKDFQQLQIIKRLNRDLNFDLKIIAAPIIRDSNGLALSSRNMRLSKTECEEIAPKIFQILSYLKKQLGQKKNHNLSQLLSEASENLRSSGFGKIDYLEICDEETLLPLTNLRQFTKNTQARIFIAIYLGKIRLIDNIAL